MSDERIQLRTPCQLSECGLCEAANILLARNEYRFDMLIFLTIHPFEFVSAKLLLEGMGARTKRNPFAPYINLVPDARLGVTEWYLRLGNFGPSVGSTGI